MATTIMDLADRIAAIFKRLHDETDAASREATTGPHTPFGEPYDDPCWHGTIREAWEQAKGTLARKVNDAREEDGDAPLTWEQWEGHEGEIEAVVIENAQTVVGSGRPVYVALCDGQYPAVFCENATGAEIEAAAATFYPED